MKDSFGRKHTINLEVPRIDPNSGTFRVNGRRKCLINQIVPCPITFPKKYDGRFESSYSSFHIYSKRTARLNYLEAYIASYRIPLIIFLAYGFGFDYTLSQFDISYSITDKKPETGKQFYRLDKKKFIVFDGIKYVVQQELINSFLKANIAKYKIDKEFPSKEFFTVLLHEMTGRVNSSYLVNNILANIVDPVARQILVNMQLPSELFSIIKYMAIKVIEGFVQDKNDLTNMRIRGSEVIVQLAQKQILAAYTEYEEQVLSGNTKADFKINPTKVLSGFINSEIVADMEYANPVEEMASLTRISPVGKGIGGLADKEAVQVDARSVHPTYYGNIDPLDTPEGGNIGITQQLAIDALITSARGVFSKRDMLDSEASGILSTSTSMIPFVENNDGVRIMMAANQSRQAQPLKNPEPPVVQSGYESLLTNVLSNNFIKKSPCVGKVTKLSTDFIQITCRDGSKRNIDITPTHLHSGSGKDTLSVFNPKVVEGQGVVVGQIIAEGSSISNGSIALGRTLCVGLMPYKGYNFEDGLVINEKLIVNDKLTSLHGIIEEVDITEKDRVLKVVDIGARTEKGEELLRKTIGEIEELIGYDEEEDTAVVSEGRFIKKSPGGVVVDIEVFSNVDPDKYPLLKNLILRTNKKYGISSTDVVTSRGMKVDGAKVRFKIEQELKIGLGDKLCNRYGNKGIISLLEKDEMMPRTPWGETLDIIMNPLGVLNRMNIGQIYELYTGLISKALALRILTASSKTQALSIVRDVIQTLDSTKKQIYSEHLLKGLNALSDNMFRLFLKQINESKFFPIVVPPFKGPAIRQLKAALKMLNLQTGYHLQLPEFGRKTEKPVPVGYMYIQKLEHLGEMKAQSRSTGPTISKTLQPTAGKRREGGQRIGEADTWALISYNCLTVLDEFFGPLSDDLVTKEEIISDIIRTGNAEYRPARTSPIRELINAYFISLMLERT